MQKTLKIRYLQGGLFSPNQTTWLLPNSEIQNTSDNAESFKKMEEKRTALYSEYSSLPQKVLGGQSSATLSFAAELRERQQLDVDCWQP